MRSIRRRRDGLVNTVGREDSGYMVGTEDMATTLDAGVSVLEVMRAVVAGLERLENLRMGVSRWNSVETETGDRELLVASPQTVGLNVVSSTL